MLLKAKRKGAADSNRGFVRRLQVRNQPCGLLGCRLVEQNEGTIRGRVTDSAPGRLPAIREEDTDTKELQFFERLRRQGSVEVTFSRGDVSARQNVIGRDEESSYAGGAARFRRIDPDDEARLCTL